MVLIFAPVTIEVINTRKIGIKFIEMRNKIFLFLNLSLNFIFFKITEIIKKNGSKIINNERAFMGSSKKCNFPPIDPLSKKE